MRTWVYVSIFVFFAAPISGGVLKVADAHKFWAESGITKDMVRAQISNAKCFTSSETLDACRAAVIEAKKEIEKPEQRWVDDDFNTVVDEIDQGKTGDKTREWLFGLMLNTYVRAFDGHASVSPKSSFDAAIGPDADVHYGAGMKILATDAGVFIRGVTPNSPADAAGIKPFDRLLYINGVEVGTGARGHRNCDLIKGDPGSVIDFVIQRGVSQLKIKVPIGVVAERNVESEVIAFNGRRYAVVRFAQFKDESCDDLKSKLRALPKGVTGTILDLRDNPGGVRDEAICVGGLFAGKRDIVGQKEVAIKFPLPTSYHPEPDGIIHWYPSYREAAFGDMPLIVLIDQNSASAAEIVAGALQDYKKAWIVGDRSQGKGTVQTLEPMPGNGLFYIGYTSALFYRPNGSTNQLAGVTPDFPVPMRRLAAPAEKRGPREGDIYPNSLHPLDAHMQWKQLRPEADVLRRCVESTAGDLTANEMITKNTGSEDYQKAYALGIFDCAVGATAQHNSSTPAKKITALKQSVK